MISRLRKVSIFILAIMLLAQPRSFADWDDHRGHDRDRHVWRYHEHPRLGLHVAFLPQGFLTVWAGHRKYFYYDGVYYRRTGGYYVVIDPPAGAVVTTIPTEFQPVVIGGVRYYTNNGIYYSYTPSGYTVVRLRLR